MAHESLRLSTAMLASLELAARTCLRAAILDDLAVTRELDPLVLAKYPEWRGSIEQYDSADSPEARRFALVFMLMQFPGTQTFVFRKTGLLGCGLEMRRGELSPTNPRL